MPLEIVLVTNGCTPSQKLLTLSAGVAFANHVNAGVAMYEDKQMEGVFDNLQVLECKLLLLTYALILCYLLNSCI